MTKYKQESAVCRPITKVPTWSKRSWKSEGGAISHFRLPNSHFYRELDDEQVNGKLDITIPIAQGRSRNNKIKFGGMYSNKQRHFEDNVFQINDAQSWGEFTGDPTEFFENNRGILDFNPEKGDTRQFVGQSP